MKVIEVPPWITQKSREHGRPEVRAALQAALKRRLADELYGFTKDLSIAQLQELVNALK